MVRSNRANAACLESADEGDPWAPFRLPEPKQEPGTFPPVELWKLLPPAPRPQPVEFGPRSPRYQQPPTPESPQRWSNALVAACPDLQRVRQKPRRDSAEGRHLRVVASYLGATVEEIGGFPAALVEERIRIRLRYFCILGRTRVALPCNWDDLYDPSRCFNGVASDLTWSLETAPADGVSLETLQTARVRLAQAMTYEHDEDDIRFRVLSQLHTLLWWMLRSRMMSDLRHADESNGPCNSNLETSL